MAGWDPAQEQPLTDPVVEKHMAQLMVDLMRQHDAPVDQYQRLGLPVAGPVGEEHLVLK